MKGKEIDDEDFKAIFNPYNEGAANSGNGPCRYGVLEGFQQTLDGSARMASCYKEPHEITKIVRKANETLTAFKERWTVETGFIIGVPETVNEMMKRLDEFVRAEEAYALAELPPGESRDIHRRLSFPAGSRDIHQRLTFPAARRDDRDDSLTKCPKEILATETQLQLPPPRPVANPLRTGDPDKYCDYYQDKGHHTKGLYPIKGATRKNALESGVKTESLDKDLRPRVK
ncbi:hypothetical protein Tco_0033413 [Tanacetum coccineum]